MRAETYFSSRKGMIGLTRSPSGKVTGVWFRCSKHLHVKIIAKGK